MSFIEVMHTYFRGEKLEALWFILPAGVLLVILGSVAIKVERGGYAWGIAIPCFLFGLILVGTGIGVGTRTTGQVAKLEQSFRENPAHMVSTELPRMEKVNANFRLTFVVFGVVTAVGLIIHYLGGPHWGRGLGAVLIFISAMGLFIDGFAERRVTKAMVELVRELNPSGKIYIMECAGDGRTSENFKRMGYNHENIPGVDAFVALGEDGDYRDVDSDDLVAVEVKNQQYKNLPKFLKNKYYFDKTYFSTDVIISLCCVKNHMNAAVTGGIKNVGIGARPANIYAPRGKTISAFVIGHTWEPINAFIHDYYSARPVDFVLSDGLQGLAYGPAAMGAPSYESAKMNMRLILASKDAVACDTVQSCIVGIDPEKVNYLKDLAAEGYGTIDTSKITVVGNATVSEVKKQFPLPDGLLGVMLSSGARKTPYEDFADPEITIKNLSVVDNWLTADIATEPKTTKIEMHIDGKLVRTFTEMFDQLTYALNGDGIKGAHMVTLRAYDRFLNCGVGTAQFEVTEN